MDIGVWIYKGRIGGIWEGKQGEKLEEYGWGNE